MDAVVRKDGSSNVWRAPDTRGRERGGLRSGGRGSRMFTIVIAAALLGLTLRMIDTLAIVSMLCILLRPARFAIILAVRFAVRELASAEAIMIVVAVVSAAVAVMIAAAAIMVVIAPPMIAVVIVIPATARYESCQKDTEAVVHACCCRIVQRYRLLCKGKRRRQRRRYRTGKQ